MAQRIFEPTWKINKDTIQLVDGDGAPSGRRNNNIPDRMAAGETPKLKFNYTVQFKFRQDYRPLYEGAKEYEDNEFSVVKVTRPQPTINYTKVNFYNFRTNVATNVDYGTINLAFYDDSKNRAHDLFESYMYAVSPIFNYKNETRTNVLDTLGIENNIASGTDMPIGGVGITNAPNTASLGSISHRHGPIRYIKVFHKYVIVPEGSDRAEVKRTIYTYLNPKITTINLEDLDMTQSAVTMVDLTFNYDSVFVTHE